MTPMTCYQQSQPRQQDSSQNSSLHVRFKAGISNKLGLSQRCERNVLLNGFSIVIETDGVHEKKIRRKEDAKEPVGEGNTVSARNKSRNEEKDCSLLRSLWGIASCHGGM